MMKMPLFGKGTKSPAEVVRILKEGLLTLEKGGDGKKQEKAQVSCKNVWYLDFSLRGKYWLKLKNSLQNIFISPVLQNNWH